MLYLLMILIIVSCFAPIMCALIMKVLKYRKSPLGEIEDFCDNRICSKFNDYEISIDEACKNFEMLDI